MSVSRILKSPKIIIYKNVEKIVNILDYYYDDYTEEVAEKILKILKIPKGKKRILNLFEDNNRLVVETNKNGKTKVKLTTRR